MMNLIALPAFADNYIWMLHDGAQAVVVDPGDAAPVHAALDELGLTLAGILVTQHHPGHVGGVDGLRPRLVDPLLRCDVPEVAASARAQGATGDDPLAACIALREWKNRFR